MLLAQMAISSAFPKETRKFSNPGRDKSRFGSYRSGICRASSWAEFAQKLTEEPQPQEPFAFGFENLNPFANSLSST